MVEQYLGKEAADDIFLSAMLTGLLPEKQASKMITGLEKGAAVNWSALKNALGVIGTNLRSGIGATIDIAKEIPPAVGKTALIGAGAGILGATTYDILKERVTQEDPEAKFNADIETMYNNKRRELDDANWMTRVRTMRDELRRGYKKMSTEEYATKYKALMNALDERKA